MLVGDFFQLPPVSRRVEEAHLTRIGDAAREEFAYRAGVWSALNPTVCYLSEQYRQEDPAFFEILSAVRAGCVEERHRALLRRRYAPHPRGDITRLYSHNADVDAINETELAKLAGAERVFEMSSSGPEHLVAPLKRGCLSPERLTLKVGARVMFTKNDIAGRKYVNGTLGTVAGFVKADGSPVVKTREGKTVYAEPAEWRVDEGGKTLARIRQAPLRLAWAITVHKSQGMSLDAAHMDLSQAFEYGQGYVALSRVRTLAGLSLAGLNARALAVHPDAREKDAEFRARSAEARAAFAALGARALADMHADFIRACGGGEAPVAGVADELPRTRDGGRARSVTRLRGRTAGVRTSRLNDTLSLVASGRSIPEAARERGRTEDTILKHLEMLKVAGAFPADACDHLRRGQRDVFAEVAALLAESDGRLKPVHERLGGRVSYETIRLVRLFL